MSEQSDATLPPGYRPEDAETRRRTKRYEPRDQGVLVTTNVLRTPPETLSPDWCHTVNEIVVTRYRDGYAYCRIAFTGPPGTDARLPEIQAWLRDRFDFPGKFGATRYGVRVEPTRSSSSVYLYIPFPPTPLLDRSPHENDPMDRSSTRIR